MEPAEPPSPPQVFPPKEPILDVPALKSMVGTSFTLVLYLLFNLVLLIVVVFLAWVLDRLVVHMFPNKASRPLDMDLIVKIVTWGDVIVIALVTIKDLYLRVRADVIEARHPE